MTFVALSVVSLQLLLAIPRQADPPPASQDSAAGLEQIPPTGASSGDASTLFATRCALCHRISGRGSEFGPDLSDAGLRLDRERIRESILSPSKVIAEGYDYVQVKLANGKLMLGILAPESAGDVIVRQPGGILLRSPKDQVVKVDVLPISGMTLFTDKLADADVDAITEWLLLQRTPVPHPAPRKPSSLVSRDPPRSVVWIGAFVTLALGVFAWRTLRRSAKTSG